ncbi:hypothetical protein DAI22_03g008850 [Oryza sativa Japonica Group]|nr:hypothetical protein DAI22_03g008850 [Oryza sativa Japonica Group]
MPEHSSSNTGQGQSGGGCVYGIGWCGLLLHAWMILSNTQEKVGAGTNGRSPRGSRRRAFCTHSQSAVHFQGLSVKSVSRSSYGC